MKISRKAKYNGISLATIVIVIAIVVIINIIVGMLMKKSNMKLDLTPNALYELSETTTGYIETIDKDVDIVITADENDLRSRTSYNYIAALFDKYEALNDKIHVSYVNIIDNPNTINKYKEMLGGEITENSVIVASRETTDAWGETIPGKIRVNLLNDLFTIDEETYYYTGTVSFTGLNVEDIITPNIMYVTEANPRKVAFLTTNMSNSAGYALQNLGNILYTNAFDIEPVDILETDLSPADYDLVIIAAPTADYTTASINKLQSFLYNNGDYSRRLVYIADVIGQTQEDMTNLDAFLAEWGQKIENTVVFEENQSVAQVVQLQAATQSVYVPVASVVDETYKLENATRPIVAPLSRPVSLLWTENNNYVTSVILQTIGSARPLNATDGSYSDDGTIRPNVITMATRDTTNSENIAVNSKVMVMGTANLADTNVTANRSYNNAEFITNLFNVFTDREVSLVYPTKTFATDPITVTASEQTTLKILLIVIIPLLIVILGIVVFIRRRNR